MLGRLGEGLALAHYERLGFRLLERNYRARSGEIDLIVCDRRAIVFAEVKTRRAGGLDPLVSITAVKRSRMRRTAAEWIAGHPGRPRTDQLRIDAIAIVVDDRGRMISLEQFEDVA